MKPSDSIATCFAIAILGVFVLVPGALDLFASLSRQHGYAMSFGKFAVLATFGECLALRIVSGTYNKPGFGVLPRMLVWGVLGVIIKAAFTLFATGTPSLLASLGLAVSATTLATGPYPLKVITAFAVSCALNIVFTPWLMTVHKISDIHIHKTGGTLSGLLCLPDVADILETLDWNVMWRFVFKRTIPLFWIPAHTITFLLPGEFRILFAAALGIMLGLILAFAGNRPAPPRHAAPA